MPKRGKTSKYYGVSCETKSLGQKCEIKWVAKQPWIGYGRVNGRSVQKHFATEREAAIYADTLTIKHHLNRPLNILKPKQTQP